jgi:hypothetical protein
MLTDSSQHSGHSTRPILHRHHHENNADVTFAHVLRLVLQLGLHPSLHTDIFREPLPPLLVPQFLCHALLCPSNDALGEEGDVLSRMSGVEADSDAGGPFWNGGWEDGFGVKYHRPSRRRWRRG